MTGIRTTGRVRFALLARVGVAVVLAAGLALAGADVASGANAQAAPAVLRALDCRSLTQCVAVGANAPDKPSQLAAEKWNGAAWVRVTVPKPSGSVTVNLNGVSCPASHPCVAVGRAYPKSGGFYAIASVWNGTRWSTAKAAAPGSSSDLFAVSCPATNSCFAAGRYTPTGSSRWTVLIEHWNGKAWARMTAPAPRGSKDAALQSVSCATKTMCVAVGGDNSGSLAERWNGKSWAATRPPTRTSEQLWGVSCPAAKTCFAVGGDNLGQGALVDQWNGRTWARNYPVVASDGSYPILRSVSCSSASACLAVGDNVSEAFTELLAGGQFVPLRQPFNGGTPRYLGQVSCVSATGCVALASAWPNSQSWRSEAEFWNGSSWQTVLTS